MSRPVANRCRTGFRAGLLMVLFLWIGVEQGSAETLVILSSPGLAAPLQALGSAFEATQSGVWVRVVVEEALDMRRRIAAVENQPSWAEAGLRGPIHLIAPGGDELIARLEQKAYVLPNSRQAYAAVSLVLVVPESVVEAPNSFEALARDPALRVAVADPVLTALGQQTRELVAGLGLTEALGHRLDVATDVEGVLSHLLNGQADVGIVFGPDAYRYRERIRMTAVAPERVVKPVLHSLAMVRSCPNRELGQAFLNFVRTAEAQAVLVALGYGLPGSGDARLGAGMPSGGEVRR